MDLLLKNGNIVDVIKREVYVSDILVKNGKIHKIGKYLEFDNVKTLNLTGKFIFPGFIDMHVHLREPGYEYKETLKTGLQAAVKGGFTGIVLMPNTNPPLEKNDIIDSVLEKCSEIDLAEVFIAGTITKDRAGKKVTDANLTDIIALTDDGSGVQKTDLMIQAMKMAKKNNLPLLLHCEDENISPESGTSEDLMVSRDIFLSEYTGACIHVQHVSTLNSINMIKYAKSNNFNVTCEVTPHHLFLSQENVSDYKRSGKYKMNPPLRREIDRVYCVEALGGGAIDVIATDHAPHTLEEKKDFGSSPFGVSGLESAVKVCFNELFYKYELTLPEIACKFSYNVAKILGLDNKGYIGTKMDADFTILDMNSENTIDVDKFSSMGKNCCFDGYRSKVDILYTIVKGDIKWQKE